MILNHSHKNTNYDQPTFFDSYLRKLFIALAIFAIIGTSKLAFAEEHDVMADDSSPPLVQIHWDDVVLDGPSTGLSRIALEFENTTEQKVNVNVSLLFIDENDPTEMEIGKKKLSSEGSMRIEVKVTDLLVQSSSISTQIIAQVQAELPNGINRIYLSEPRYFHTDSHDGTATIYTELQMADLFNGGLVDPSDPTIDLTTLTIVNRGSEEDLEDHEDWDSYSSETAEVSLLAGGSGKRVCAYWTTTFEDYHIGDGFGTGGGKSTQYQRARYARARVRSLGGGSTIWSGYLDENGCTPYLGLPPFAAFYELVLNSKTYLLTDSRSNLEDVKYRVKACSGRGPACYDVEVVKVFLAGSSTNYVYLTTTGGWVNAMALTGWLLASPDSGTASYSYTVVKMGHYCPGWYPQWVTSCWDSSANTVYINTSMVDEMYVLAHEIGHQCQYDITGGLGGSYEHDVEENEWMCNCEHVESSNQEHCMQSRELFGTAVKEGFGYFFAAKLFNDETQDDCQMAHGKEFREPYPWDPYNEDAAIIHPPPVTYDCRTPISWQRRWCQSDIDIDTGVEWDWMNFFWEWHTGGSTDWRKVVMSEIYEVIDAEDNLGVENWAETESGAQVYFGGPDAPKFEYFDSLADIYGIKQGPSQ